MISTIKSHSVESFHTYKLHITINTKAVHNHSTPTNLLQSSPLKMEGYIYPPPQQPHQFGYYNPPPPPPRYYHHPPPYPSPAGYYPPPPAAVPHHPPPPYHQYPSPQPYYYPAAGAHQPQTSSPHKASTLGKIAGQIVGGLGLGIAANAISGAI
nr:hypothetical protein Iba_chr05fCG6680 [Ipomoea batatas]